MICHTSETSQSERDLLAISVQNIGHLLKQSHKVTWVCIPKWHESHFLTDVSKRACFKAKQYHRTYGHFDNQHTPILDKAPVRSPPQIPTTYTQQAHTHTHTHRGKEKPRKRKDRHKIQLYWFFPSRIEVDRPQWKTVCFEPVYNIPESRALCEKMEGNVSRLIREEVKRQELHFKWVQNCVFLSTSSEWLRLKAGNDNTRKNSP